VLVKAYALSHCPCLVVVGNEYPAAKLSARVPLDVIGDPLTLNPVGAVSATEVTEPLPLPLLGI
jgi:hypothetical protein